ncbi:MAG: DUF2764 family protein [Rikenellaceae bacterium]
MFKKKYISLVAGLREYSLETDSKGLDLGALLEEVYGELAESDAESVRLLYGLYDCENICAAYNGRSNHNPLGRLSREQVEAAAKGESNFIDENIAEAIESLPKQVQEMLADWSMAQSQMEMSFDKALFGAYYEACEASKSNFIREWSVADRNLRNVAAALTARATGRAIEQVVVGEGGVVEQLKRSSAADFGLRGELSYIDTVISAVSEEQNIVEKERKIDAVRWEIAEELAEGEYFSADCVLAYLAKVNIVARWMVLSPEVGREMFAKLMEDLSGKRVRDGGVKLVSEE